MPSHHADLDTALHFDLDGLRYSLDSPPSKRGRSKSIVSVTLDGDDPGPPLVDRCDLYGFRSRYRLAGLIADAFGRQRGQVLGHLAVVLDTIERATDAPVPESTLTEQARHAAEHLLAQDDLLDRAVGAMEANGLVGEEANARLLYLVATSRLFERPLSALLLSPAGSGKSHLLSAVTALLPEEALVLVTRLTAQSLFYAGEDALRHRVVVVEEYEGAGDADHPLRVLQSAGELRLTLTSKGKAETFVVRGPAAVLSGTTASNLDVQNTSRCLLLELDTSPEQTARIQRAQARTWAGETKTPHDLQVWRDAQRVLATTPVVTPFAMKLRFPTRTVADRRTSAKVMSLVAAHALLHQSNRERDEQGRVVAVPGDYSAVHALLAPSVAQEIVGLSPRAARLHRTLASAPTEAISRREVAARLGWSYATARRAMAELVVEELVRVEDATEVPRRYRLVPQPGPLGDAFSLTAPEELEPA